MIKTIINALLYSNKKTNVKGKRQFYLICVFISLWLLLPLSAIAKNKNYTDHGEWSFSLLVGGHSPALKGLYKGLYLSPVAGEGSIGQQNSNQDGDGNGVEAVPIYLENPLIATPNGAKAGLELQWHANKTHTLVFGIGSWEKTTIGFLSAEIPTQRELNQVIFERRAKISYSEYSIGWQFSFFRRPKYQFYFKSGFNEVFDIDYREEYIFNYNDDSSLNNDEISGVVSGSEFSQVRRIQVMEAQTASLFMAQAGLGMERFFTKWFALGIEVSYLAGERQVQLRDQSIKKDSGVNDSLNVLETYQNLVDDTDASNDNNNIGYLVEGTTKADAKYKPLKLKFDGWQVMLKMNIYY